jgi:hypothetical protein
MRKNNANIGFELEVVSIFRDDFIVLMTLTVFLEAVDGNIIDILLQ